MILANTIGDHYETHLCCIGFAIDACKLASAAAWRMASAASISKNHSAYTDYRHSWRILPQRGILESPVNCRRMKCRNGAALRLRHCDSLNPSTKPAFIWNRVTPGSRALRRQQAETWHEYSWATPRYYFMLRKSTARFDMARTPVIMADSST